MWFSNICTIETHVVCDTCLAANSSCPPTGLKVSAAGAYYATAASTRHSKRVKDKGKNNKNNDVSTLSATGDRIIKLCFTINKNFGCYYKFWYLTTQHWISFLHLPPNKLIFSTDPSLSPFRSISISILTSKWGRLTRIVRNVLWVPAEECGSVLASWNTTIDGHRCLWYRRNPFL